MRQIHLYVATQSELKTEHIRQIMIRSIGSESEHSRVVADRWELFEDLAVGADLLIDACAITTGIYRYTVSGELKEGFAGFGYLAVVGMALLILYFIIRAKGEEPCKRKAKYLTHILRTPITIHRTYGPETPSTFYPGSEIS